MGPEFGNYLTFTKGGEQIAGGMRNDGQSGAPDGWTVYLKADDAGRGRRRPPRPTAAR